VPCLPAAADAVADQQAPQPVPGPVVQPAPQPSPSVIQVCTGDAEVDSILDTAGVRAATRLESSEVYDWEGFCEAARSMDVVGLPLFPGTGSGSGRVAQALANVASLLAQSMWESGGEAPWSACDENNYLGTETAPCTQRGDGQRYDSLTGPPACEVDLQMRMVAETAASWTPGPMSCVPGTITQGCCWWGRGAIQTTGPHNYRMLQRDVVSKVEGMRDVDLCVNPEAICQNRQLKWLGALYYWTSVVQKAGSFQASLEAYVASGFSDAGSVVGGASFNTGTGGMVNNGFWSAQAHGNQGRMQYFHEIIEAMKAAGMTGGGGAGPAPAPAGPSCEAECMPLGETCFVPTWGVPCFTPAGGRQSCESMSGEFCGETAAQAVAPNQVRRVGVAACGVGAIGHGDSVYFKAPTGKRLTVQVDAVHAKWDHMGEWQAFVLEREAGAGLLQSGDAVFLVGHNGHLVTVEGKQVHSKWSNRGTWERLIMNREGGFGTVCNGDSVFLVAHTGNLIAVEGSRVQAQSSNRSDSALFTVERKGIVPHTTSSPP